MWVAPGIGTVTPARFDSESWTYGYSFAKHLMREWDWKEDGGDQVPLR